MKERPAAASFDAAFSARAASDAAAARERDKEAPRDRPSKPPPAAEAGLPRRALVDLLAFDEALPARLRRDPAFAKLLARGTRGFLFPDEAASRGDGDEGKARWDVLRLLSYAAPLELGQVRDVVAASFEDESQLELPVAVVTGELRPSYEEAELLDVAVQVAQPLAGSNKALPPLLKQAEAAMQAKWAPPREVAMNVVRQIEQAVNAAPGLPARYFATQLERGLLEGRKYKRRVLFGGPRLRADLVFPSGVEVPIYLPEKTADLLPMLPSLAVVAVVELRPREDASEASSEALVGLAVGRVVRRAPVK